MDFCMIDEGLKLVEQASNILEGISNEPGVTPLDFYKALDLLGITDEEQREVLMQAAATVEMTLELVTDISYPTIN
jgi:alkylhydroperoxidase/carboxymuconolactone decarboxylase family protein YurZ